MDETIEIKLVRIEEKQISLIDKVDAILEQTTKTNGRVNEHDKAIANIFQWRAVVTAKFNTIIWIVGAIGTIVGYAISVYFK